jgi:hypothetical protein
VRLLGFVVGSFVCIINNIIIVLANGELQASTLRPGAEAGGAGCMDLHGYWWREESYKKLRALPDVPAVVGRWTMVGTMKTGCEAWGWAQGDGWPDEKDRERARAGNIGSHQSNSFKQRLGTMEKTDSKHRIEGRSRENPQERLMAPCRTDVPRTTNTTCMGRLFVTMRRRSLMGSNVASRTGTGRRVEPSPSLC